MENKQERINKRYFDFSLLFIVLFLLAFGLVMVYSTSSYSASLDFDGDSLYYLKRQLISVAVGLVVMALAALFPYGVYKKLAGPAYLFGLVSILLILTPLGYTANGAKRWLRFGSLSIQPAEICKLCVIIFVASLLSKMGPKVRAGWKGFWFPMIPTGIICALIYFLTDNLSSALIIGLIP
ncbi:MAG: FtsW/RodA/SpoVE family cell cycle protein, partial [Lachnospiraceae bacterium]|nr:FtsW/RodA/SpoVE family cell cycle protein [Lachnospiraceae bacterium]